MIELMCGVTGAIAGFAMIPIYRRAFRTQSYGRVLWAVPVVALIIGSLWLAIWVAGEQPEERQLLSLGIWLLSGLLAFGGGWRVSGSAAKGPN